MKSRTNAPINDVRGALSAVDVALLQTLFDQAPDIAFFGNGDQGRHVAVNESLVMRRGLKHKSEVLPETKKPDPATMEQVMVQIDYDGNLTFPEISKGNQC